VAGLAGCASRYFKDAGAPPALAPRHDLATLPVREYWTGVIFNGDKVGFTHLSIRPVPDEPGRFVIESDAALLLRVFGWQKAISLRAEDVVDADLRLYRFRYDHNLDGNELKLDGRIEDSELRVEILNAGRREHQMLKPNGPVYPASATNLYPVVNGLALGKAYRYRIYSGETQRLLDVEQRVEAYQTSDLFLGSAFKVDTAYLGYGSSTWIDARGQPLLELALNGVLISALEGESEAKRYLTLAALNKREALLEFSLVKPDRPIPGPRQVHELQIELTGAPWIPPSGGMQECERLAAAIGCTLRTERTDPAPGDLTAYLRPTLTVPSDAPRIRDAAAQIAGDATTPEQKVDRLLAWIQANIKRVPVDAFSALDVLERKQAECQGHTYLFAAFARALDIPTRVVNGLAYSEQFRGFLYHTWAEIYQAGAWQAIDPTFGQRRADATHLKLIEGESTAEVLPLVEWLGKVKIRVMTVGASAQATGLE
jgi:transglutaminase-like putative cysteine protease